MVPKLYLLKIWTWCEQKVMKKAISAFNHSQNQVKNPNLQLQLKWNTIMISCVIKYYLGILTVFITITNLYPFPNLTSCVIGQKLSKFVQIETILKKSFKMKSKLDTHISSGHEGKKTFDLDVKYVAKALPKRQTWLLTLVQFMRERSNSSVVFVTTELLKRII